MLAFFLLKILIIFFIKSIDKHYSSVYTINVAT